MAKVFVKNTGLEPAGPFTVRGYISETNPRAITAVQIFEKTYTSLDPGVEDLIKVKKRKLGKNIYLVVELDVNKEINEGDETNNSTGKKLK